MQILVHINDGLRKKVTSIPVPVGMEKLYVEAIELLATGALHGVSPLFYAKSVHRTLSRFLESVDILLKEDKTYEELVTAATELASLARKQNALMQAVLELKDVDD